MALRFFALLFFSTSAYAQSQCFDIFKTSSEEKIYVVPASLAAQAQKLAPHWEMESLESLYIHLVKEDLQRSSSPENLPIEIEQHLRQNFSNAYDLPADPKALKMFYTNALSPLYNRIAWEWKSQVVEHIVSKKLSHDTLQAVESLMDSFYSVRGFAEPPYAIESVITFFAEKPWMNYPWKEAIEIVEHWNASTEAKEIGFSAFYKWHEQQTGLPNITFSNLERIYMALVDKSSVKIFCCKSACLSCPNNLAWKKEKKD